MLGPKLSCFKHYPCLTVLYQIRQLEVVFIVSSSITADGETKGCTVTTLGTWGTINSTVTWCCGNCVLHCLSKKKTLIHRPYSLSLLPCPIEFLASHVTLSDLLTVEKALKSGKFKSLSDFMTLLFPM